MAIHSPDEFVFMKGDALDSIRYPDEGKESVEARDDAILGYPLAYLHEMIKWRFHPNTFGIYTDVSYFSKNIRSAYLQRIADELNTVVDKPSGSYIQRALTTSDVSSKVVSELSSSFDDRFQEFLNAYSSHLVDTGSLPHNSATAPKTGDCITKDYLTALQRSLASFDAVAYDYVTYIEQSNQTDHIGGSGTYTSEWLESAKQSCKGFGYAYWDFLPSQLYSEGSNGIAYFGYADDAILATVTPPKPSAANFKVPIESVKCAIPLKITNYGGWPTGNESNMRYANQTFYAWWICDLVRDEVDDNVFVLKGNALAKDMITNLISLCGITIDTTPAYSYPISGSKYNATVNAYQYITIEPMQLSKTIVKFKHFDYQ